MQPQTTAEPISARRALLWVCAMLLLSIWISGVHQADFAYTREGLQQMQLWRAWSGHFTHYDWLHFAGDWLVLLPCLLWFAANRQITALVSITVLAPLLLSAVFYVMEPHLMRYQGASGIACAALTWLGVAWCKSGPRRTFGCAVLLLLGGKIFCELTGFWPIIMPSKGVISLALAHWAGALFGLIGGSFLAPFHRDQFAD